MQHWLKKLISLCLAVAVLLAPLEFSLAHEMVMQTAAHKAMGHHASHGQERPHDSHHHAGQHASHDQHQQQPDDNSDGCKSDGFCKTCVYCSPAISSTTQIQLDRPVVIPTAIVISAYSIDLPLDLRPPKPL